MLNAFDGLEGLLFLPIEFVSARCGASIHQNETTITKERYTRGTRVTMSANEPFSWKPTWRHIVPSSIQGVYFTSVLYMSEMADSVNRSNDIITLVYCFCLSAS